MRRNFAKLLHNEMIKNENIWVITGDLGYGMFDNIKRDFSDRFVNVGAAEQLMIGAAIGLSYEGKIPVTYSITPFALCRPFELIRTYINYENIPVKMVGGGRNKEYSHDGFSHWADDDTKILSLFENIVQYRPYSIEELKSNFNEFIYNDKPAFLSLSKKIVE